MRMCRRSSHSQEAVATIYGPTLSGPEWNGRLDPAQRAFNRYLYALAREGLTESLHIGCNAFILFYLTRLASLGFVLQSFIGKKQLFTRSEDKLLTAIYTSQNLILVLVHCGPPVPCSLEGM